VQLAWLLRQGQQEELWDGGLDFGERQVSLDESGVLSESHYRSRPHCYYYYYYY
jgi:hypothetical protein